MWNSSKLVLDYGIYFFLDIAHNKAPITLIIYFLQIQNDDSAISLE